MTRIFKTYPFITLMVLIGGFDPVQALSEPTIFWQGGASGASAGFSLPLHDSNADEGSYWTIQGRLVLDFAEEDDLSQIATGLVFFPSIEGVFSQDYSSAHLDIEVVRNHDFDWPVTGALALSAGFRLTNNDLTTRFTALNVPGASAVFDSHYLGVGPVLGLQTQFLLTDRLHLSVTGRAAVTYGTLQSREAVTVVGPSLLQIATPSPNASDHELSTMLEGEAVLAYRFPEYHAQVGLGISVFSLFNAYERDLRTQINGSSLPTLPAMSYSVVPFVALSIELGE